MAAMSTSTMSDADTRIEQIETRLMALKKELSEARRARPHEPVEDWELRDTWGAPVRLSELFGEHRDLIVVHNMGRGCKYCSLWADGLAGFAKHWPTRCAFVLCSNDPPTVARDFAAQRGWPYRVVSGATSGFAKAMGFTGADGSPHPGASAFRRLDDDRIVRTGRTPFGPGDDFCAVWPLFDMLDGGVGAWEPAR